MELSLSSQTKSLLSKNNVRLKKSLGQNLMIDKAVIQRMIEAAELSKDDTVLEIGTGTGLLTKELAKAAGKIVTFEVDRNILKAAREYLASCRNVEIVNEDFLKGTRDWGLGAGKNNSSGTSPRLPAPKLVANIPYYITTPIIEKILTVRAYLPAGRHGCHTPLTLAVLTVQREFAERMSAKPGTKEYGSFTVFLDYHCEAELVSLVPKTAFMPQPDIGSAVIRLKFRKSPPVAVKDEKLFFEVVRASFSQRRKTLRNCLLTKFDQKIVDAALSASGIDGKRRGETLSTYEFARLASNI